jgi:FlaA1/EpsC-like NDP-sugar epimerase
MQPIQLDARALGAALHDAAALVAACLGATLLLDQMGADAARDLSVVFFAAVPIQIAINFVFGIYQGIWRYTSLPDIQRIVFAVLTGTVVTSIALRAMGLDASFTYREYILYPIFLVTLMSLSRMAYRSFKEWALYGRGEQGAPVIVMGAGDAAVGLVKELSRSHEWRVVGFLDDDEK